jgi:hypothetical protein
MEMCFDWHPSYIGTLRVHRGASFLSDISNLDLAACRKGAVLSVHG